MSDGQREHYEELREERSALYQELRKSGNDQKEYLVGETRWKEINAELDAIEAVWAEEGKAKERIVAAAPDLLEACKEALRHLKSVAWSYSKNQAEEILFAAIAKAEGGEK